MLFGTRGSRTRKGVAVAGVAALLLAGVTAAEANLTGSPFDAGDGNLILNDEAQDWANAPGLAVGIDKPTGQTDDSLGNGTKEDDPVPSVIDGSIPNNKSDLTRFYVANEKVGGKEFLYLAWERVQEPSGTTNMDFEFNQSETLSANGVTPVRTAGDVLIKYDLAQGGVNAILGYHRWVTTGIAAQVCEAANKLPCWDKVHPLGANFEASINQEVVTDPIAPNAPRNLSVRTFGEAAINLTDSNILPPGTCSGFAGAYLKSRSSDSFTAAIKDFIAPIGVNIQNCGTLIIEKQTVGGFGTFDFDTNVPGHLDVDITTSSGNNPNSQTITQVPQGTYNISETAQTGWQLTSATCDNGDNPSAVTLDPNDTVTCTFVNTAQATLRIDKVTQPAADPTSFSFTASGGLASPFNLTDQAAAQVYSNITPGQYTVTETNIPAGWVLTGRSCGTHTADTSVTGAITVTLAAGDDVTCTFTNRKNARVTINKADDDNTPNALNNAVFSIYEDVAPASASSPGAEDLAGTPVAVCNSFAAGSCTTGYVLTPGTFYWVVETTTPEGYTTAAPQRISGTAGQTVSVSFTDKRQFKVITLVCDLTGDDTLYPSGVTLDGTGPIQSLSAAQLEAFNTENGTSLTEAQVCSLMGAVFAPKHYGSYSGTVNIPQ